VLGESSAKTVLIRKVAKVAAMAGEVIQSEQNSQSNPQCASWFE
jgi:hypothetical protein